ncbi:BTAD domain-containing putative transcriptional regulator [Amycolatopsis sp. DG1A-15b]|uniref:AfsR/SARP family transcriptional regulator n=1 Tax=Amycolatopsis sp. DG1A-15b TaxID=3052846 RepID=UPI00255C263B|nr:BTAD domain-containing putative transcriptional regulator [Amycolatopsis sp. DG1A-15b]WIX87992.1 BTAD domain-containing putative transcriptional regulator [Amycolatopsis sp. DG1A-15b]
MEFGVLGALRVRIGAREVPVPAGKHRVVLASLLLRAGQVVSVAELIEHLWADAPPPGARSTVQTYVQRLRRAFAPAEPITTHRDGYSIEVGPGALDLDAFRTAVAGADAVRGNPLAEAEALRAGLALWRGPVLSDVPSESLRATVAPSLSEERLQVLQRVIDVELAAGRHAELVAELRGLTAEHPMRERFWAQLMLALHRAGRQAEALAAYRTVRTRLRDELGIEPGDRLRELHQAVLTGEVEASAAGPPPPVDPAHSAPWVAQCTLPLDVRVFAGRADLVDQLLITLTGAAVPVVGVCGPAGVGKTALAVRVAHRLRAAFPDGQWHVRLGRAELSEVLADLLHATGLDRAHLPASVEARAAQLRARLADRRVLLLLDDAADAEQVRPLLPGTPGCAVLVTSRVHLGGLAALHDARVVTLDTLSPDEARTLFTDLLGAGTADPAALAEVARLCGYLPLALRLAAANFDGGVEHYLAELRAGDRLGRLAVPGDPRAAVRTTFALSYHALPDRARRLFRLLGLVPGQDFGAEVAAAVLGCGRLCGGPGGEAPGPERSSGCHCLPEAQEALDHLVSRHMLGRPVPGRFQFHDLMRLYATECARSEEPAEDRRAALRRLFAHYLDAADAAGTVLYPDLSRLPRPRPGARFGSADQARDHLETEHANLMAAIEAAEPAGLPSYAWHLADALRGYFHSRSTTTQWASAARTALRAAVHARDEGARAAMHMSLGILAWTLGRHTEALDEMGQALERSRRAGLVPIEGAALLNMGIIQLEIGKPAPAVELFAEGRELGRRTGQDFVVANALLNSASAHLELGELEVARECSEQAMAICDRVRSPHAAATARSNLGQVHLAAGRLRAAQEHLTAALAAFETLGSAVDAAETLSHLAAVHRDAGRADEASGTARKALAAARSVDAVRVLGEALVAQGTVDQLDGRHREALAHFREAADLFATDEHSRVLGDARIGLAVSYRHLGSLAKSAHYVQTALAGAVAAGRNVQRGTALTALALTEHRLGRRDAAETAARAAVECHARTGHRLGEDRARAALAEITDALTATRMTVSVRS